MGQSLTDPEQGSTIVYEDYHRRLQELAQAEETKPAQRELLQRLEAYGQALAAELDL